MGYAILLGLAGLATGSLAAVPGGRADSIGVALLGVVLAAYVRFHGGVRSRAHLAAVFLAPIVGYNVMMFLGFATVVLAFMSNQGQLATSVMMAPAGAIGAALVGVVFLIFTLKPIAGFACYPPNDTPFASDTIPFKPIQLRVPARHEYHLQCYPGKEGPHALSTVHVSIVQYPNDARARYDLRNQDGYDKAIQDPRNVKRITKHGRPVFTLRSRTYWSSGDKVITISGSAPPEILDAFVEGYLRRYPNSLEPDFDLPYQTPR